MARPFAETRTRIAVLGAASPEGAHLKTALANRNVPGERVVLYGHGRDVAVISEYDGEARLVQPAVDLDAGQYGSVFVCERGHDAGALVAASSAGTFVVDLTGTIPGARLAGTPQYGAAARVVSIPHPLSLALEALLGALHRALGLSFASAFILRPASDFGQPGLEELREQTVRLLRFESAPTDVFGRQLAFSVIPEHLFQSGEDDCGARIGAECRALLGAPALRIAVSTALTPTFLGHAIALHAELDRGAAEDARQALAGVPGVVLASDPEVGTNLDAPEEPGLVVARVEDAGPGVVRLWVLASEPGAVAAVRAIDVASSAGVLVKPS
jgi:aspartate-semialdehyde dehydrogenase